MTILLTEKHAVKKQEGQEQVRKVYEAGRRIISPRRELSLSLAWYLRNISEKSIPLFRTKSPRRLRTRTYSTSCMFADGRINRPLASSLTWLGLTLSMIPHRLPVSFWIKRGYPELSFFLASELDKGLGRAWKSSTTQLRDGRSSQQSHHPHYQLAPSQGGDQSQPSGMWCMGCAWIMCFRMVRHTVLTGTHAMRVEKGAFQNKKYRMLDFVLPHSRLLHRQSVKLKWTVLLLLPGGKMRLADG